MKLIMAPPPPGGLQRAKALVESVTRLNLTKYNLSGTLSDLPPGDYFWRVGSTQYADGEASTSWTPIEKITVAGP